MSIPKCGWCAKALSSSTSWARRKISARAELPSSLPTKNTALRTSARRRRNISWSRLERMRGCHEALDETPRKDTLVGLRSDADCERHFDGGAVELRPEIP